jgi:dihydrofolate synthase/folylpolyglutamate synthase
MQDSNTLDFYYDQAIRQIQGIESKGSRHTLFNRMQEALKEIKLSPSELETKLKGNAKRITVVAGTNGKGSVSATLASLLQGEGERVGLFTSPHLISIRERIQVNREPVSKRVFLGSYERVGQVAKKKDLPFFGLLTLMAVDIFFSGRDLNPVDRAVFEVGLGGLYDPTNAIPHGISVITSLGLDHQHLLGEGYASIARNKFGIVRDCELPSLSSDFKMDVIHPVFPERVASKISGVLDFTKDQQKNARWHETRPLSYRIKQKEVHNQIKEPFFYLKTSAGEAPCLLQGERGVENISLAVKAYECGGFEVGPNTLKALEKLHWGGRMERRVEPSSNNYVYLSADHNKEGIESLIKLLSHYSYETLYILFGLGKTKDLKSTLGQLLTLPNAKITLTESPFQGRSLSNYGDWLEQVEDGVSDPEKALHKICEKASSPGDLVLVTGSVYLIGHLYKKTLAPHDQYDPSH